MTDTILVNFHCHTFFSDGEQTPEALAANLAAAGVRYAALTDHDTLEGLPRFQTALKKHGITFLSGVEITTLFNGREAHLLGYGFDPESPELAATLLSLRQSRPLEVHSIAGTLRKAGSGRLNHAETPASASQAPNGTLEIGEAIALVQRAGGCTFWAHPLQYEKDPEKLDALCIQLKNKGLDGIEAIYASYSEADRDTLKALAEKHDLLCSAGTDFHGINGLGSSAYHIEMPRREWVKFRSAVFAKPSFSSVRLEEGEKGAASLPAPPHSVRQTHRFRRRSFALRIFLPTLIAVALFISALWAFILPSFEETLLERKREMIRELTNSAWSILASYHRDELIGSITRQQAQSLAIQQVEALRYGPEGKDYFWIQDMQPRMIMHPYRTDLNGQELLNFTDPLGNRIFVEFANLVKSDGEGYINYVWQWKDDPQRLEPKESFVKGFEPWGWIIGTGVYIDDVHQEIARIERKLINTSLTITGAIVLLLLFVLQQSLRIERQRQEVVDELRASTDRYHSLAEATTEGTLLILDGKCRYANPILLSMLGYTARQLEFLELLDLLPRDSVNSRIWENFENLNNEPSTLGQALEGCLKRQDGSLVESLITLNPIQVSGQQGFILLAKDLARKPDNLESIGLSQAAQSVQLGIFRAIPARRGVFLELNQAGHSLFSLLKLGENTQPALVDLFTDTTEFDQVLHTILVEGRVEKHLLHLESSDAIVHVISLSARLVRDEQGHPAFIDGTLEDVTAAQKLEVERETQVEKLQATLLFLHEPLSHLGRDVLVCRLDTSIGQLSNLMTQRRKTAALVASEAGMIIGIVTDHDLRARALAGTVDLKTPIHTIMTSPIIKISESARIYEALICMEETGVSHLAVEDENGQIINIIDAKSLIQFRHYGPIVLTREIARSKSLAEVATFGERAAPLVKTLLDSSARPGHITGMLSSVCDASTNRLIELAVDELGPPPVPFVFIAMGSQGRQEQTLLSDQDNGIIFQLAGPVDVRDISQYFLNLGAQVSEGLKQAGYPLCRGGVMASNPRWCRSLPDWLSSFDDWVRRSEPQEIIDLSIFFDFRTVYGEENLTHRMRQHIHHTLSQTPDFFTFLAQNTLQFKPPIRLPGNIYLGGGSTEHVGEINLKDVMMPIVSFARLYSLRHQINQTHTLERINALAERGLILPSSRDEIITSYDFLMQLRLQNQITAFQTGKPLNNHIHPGRLSYIQQEMLKQAFSQVAAVQKKVSFDFPGAA